MSLCTQCPKRATCTSLCEEAEKYVNQDYRYQRESLYPPIRNREDACFNLILDNINWHLNEKPSASQVTIKRLTSLFQGYDFNFPFLTPLQNKCLYLFYFEGLSYAKIAFQLSNQYRQVSSRAVKHQLARARKEIVAFFPKNEGGIKENAIKS